MAGRCSTFTYNDLNQLTSEVTSGQTSTYQYDPLGDLVATVDNGQTMQYLIDPTGLGNVVGEYDGIGNLIAHYTWGIGLSSRVDAAGVAAYYDSNIVGSTVGITGPQGSYVNTYSYLPFGEQVASVKAVANPFTYIGTLGVMDVGNGLELMRARTYNPMVGEFLQVDPFEVLTANRPYQYAGSNPASNSDPLGLFTTKQVEKMLEQARQGSNFDRDFQRLMDRLNEDTSNTLEDIQITKETNYWIDFVAEHLWDLGRDFVLGNVFGLYWEGAELIADIRDLDLLQELLLQWLVKQLEPGDPNDITGPGGYGPAGFVPANQDFPYTIQFQNDATATAPAQVVEVTETLDPNLDWSTFQLGDFGFGGVEVLVPPGLSSYTARSGPPLHPGPVRGRLRGPGFQQRGGHMDLHLDRSQHPRPPVGYPLRLPPAGPDPARGGGVHQLLGPAQGDRPDRHGDQRRGHGRLRRRPARSELARHGADLQHDRRRPARPAASARCRPRRAHPTSR